MPLTKRPKITPRKIAANRANAKKSTGPLTADGKQHCRFNALTHGATARELKATMHSMGEDPDQYDRLRGGFLASLPPASFLESYLLENLAETAWRQERLIRSQYAMQAHAVGRYVSDKEDGVERDRSLSANVNWRETLRLEGQLSRHFERQFKMLMRLRSAREDESASNGQPAESSRQSTAGGRQLVAQTSASEEVCGLSAVGGRQNAVAQGPLSDPAVFGSQAGLEESPEAPEDEKVPPAAAPDPDWIDPEAEDNLRNRTHDVDPNKKDRLADELVKLLLTPLDHVEDQGTIGGEASVE